MATPWMTTDPPRAAWLDRRDEAGSRRRVVSEEGVQELPVREAWISDRKREWGTGHTGETAMTAEGSRARGRLLRAVLKDPDDDRPRLAYADWCAKHGDPDRAELIRA